MTFFLFLRCSRALLGNPKPLSLLKKYKKKCLIQTFGIKEGLHIFLSIFFKINRNKLAIYEDNQFKPYMDSEAIDRFVRTKTNTFAFQIYEFKGQAKLIDEYVKEFNIKKDVNESSSEVLSIARKLTKRMSHLPDFDFQQGIYYLLKHKNLGMNLVYLDHLKIYYLLIFQEFYR